MLRSPRDFAALGNEGHGRSHALVAVRLRRNDLGHERFGSRRQASGSDPPWCAIGPTQDPGNIRSWERGSGPGWDILVVARPPSLGATSEEWVSMEWGMRTSIALEPPFTRVMATLSPCSTTMGVDTPVPR